MMKTDISYLVEPLYPMDFVYIEEEDLNNYFRGMIWYTPKYQPTEFDASVFNEIEVHNLDILACLDTY